MFGLYKSKLDRCANRAYRNTINLEIAADKGAWEIAAFYARRQDPLLRDYYLLDGASNEHLEKFFRDRGLPKSATDSKYHDWICDELFKRGLQPL